MFPSALRRNTGTGALQDLEQRLLHTLTRHIACDGGIVGLPGDLVHFINIYYAGLCLLDVEVSGLDELEKDVLNVFAHVPCLCKRGSISYSKGHIENAGQGLGKQGLPAAVGPINMMLDFSNSTSESSPAAISTRL